MVEEPRKSPLRLRDRIAGLLCYLVGPLALLLPGTNPMVRFHAIQATLAALVLAILNLAGWVLLATIFRYSWYTGVAVEPYIPYLRYAQFVGWLVMLYFGFELAHVEIPTIGEPAKRLAGLRQARTTAFP